MSFVRTQINLCERLTRGLRQAGVLGPADRNRVARAAVERRGRRHLTAVQGLLGPAEFDTFVSHLRVARPMASCRRVLGFGDALTDFATIHVSLEPAMRSRLLRIGAFSNFIVSAFDRIIDIGTNAAELLGRDALDAHVHRLRAGSGRSPINTKWSGAGGFQQLVTTYFAELERLPFAQRRPDVRETLSKAIVRMYQAELDTQRSTRVTDKTLLRIGALPFVAMSFPVWLAASGYPDDMARCHLRWLYRLGDFIGWVDDMADASLDRRNGQANRVLRARASRRGPQSYRAVVAHVVRKGRRVVDEWNDRWPRSGNSTADVRAAFSVCIDSWLASGRRSSGNTSSSRQ